MDNEFRSLVTAVRDGSIRDDDHAREIIANARTAVEAKEEALDAMKMLLFEAESAFIRGWDHSSAL